MIIPISAFCTNRMESLMNLFRNFISITYVSNYAERPGKLFEGAERNLSIVLSQKDSTQNNHIYTSLYYKWKAENRNLLFSNIVYFFSSEILLKANFPKIGNKTELSILKKMRLIKNNLGMYTTYQNKNIFFYKNSGGRYWKFMANFKLIFYLNGQIETY